MCELMNSRLPSTSTSEPRLCVGAGDTAANKTKSLYCGGDGPARGDRKQDEQVT